MFVSPIFLTADANLGRVNLSSLSDQTLMEMLIEGCPENLKKHYRDSDGCFNDVCRWPAVICDADERVVEYHMGLGKRCGSIELAYLPPKMQSFVMPGRSACGTLETTMLPESLRTLRMPQNEFEGTVDFAHLPRSLVQLAIFLNKFTGSADLQDLPPALWKLWIYSNKFSGTLCLSKLPSTLDTLDVSHNSLSGNIFFENVPQFLRVFCANGNNFNASAIVAKDERVPLSESGLRSVVDVEGNTHPLEKEMLTLRK